MTEAIYRTQAARINEAIGCRNPVLGITWKPWGDADYHISHVDVVMALENPRVAAGGNLVSLWVNVASIPCSEMTSQGLRARDAQGELALESVVEKDSYGFDIRRWRPLRATHGHVVLTYRFLPRIVPEDYRFRPYYDFRTEPFGATCAGVSSLVVPSDGTYDIHIQWDLSQMPPDTTAMTVAGEGDVRYTGKPSDYQFTLYAVGKLKKKVSEDGRFRVYWLNEPLPDAQAVLDGIPKILKGMADFFEDPAILYTVLFRKDPFRMSNGATAYSKGFIYGYSDEKPLRLKRALDIFAHEVVHTWPRLEDKAGEGTWYHEGTAELYSILIPYRLGLLNLGDVAETLGWRGLNYYNNPHNGKSNTEVYPLYWGDRKAQALPYGRGFFYLVDADMRIRQRSGGIHSVDDLVLETLRRARAGKNVTNADWRELICAELGDEAGAHFDAVCQGTMVEPCDDWFGGAFKVSRGRVFEPVREFDETGYVWTPVSGHPVKL